MYNLPCYKTPPNRSFVRESRPYDFLYDATYTVPSRADFLQSLKYGTRSGAQTKIRPVYDSMFSAVKTDVRNISCMTKRSPDVIDNFVHQYDVNGVPIIPADTGPLPTPRLVDEVTGANRYKYAIRYGHPTYKMDMNESMNQYDPEDQKGFENQFQGPSRTVNKSIQTDYRESECQTDPYSPPYYLPYPGAYPKLLALVKLTWEKGLPFSLDDIVIIERALSKRILEHIDHGVEDDKDFEKRIKLMEELEAQQWVDREKELDRLCQRKMELTSRLIQEYASRVSNEHTLRLERLHDRLKAKSHQEFTDIKHRYFRDIRKLEKKYLYKQKPRQRDIIKDYTEPGSSVYAPLARDGLGIDEMQEEPTEFGWNIRDYEKIDAITKDPTFIRRELTFDVDRFKDKLEKCKPTGTTKRLERKLEDIYNSFKDYGAKGKEALHWTGNLDGRDQSRRPSTPELVIDEDPEMELRRPHVVLLQKISRGRTIQKLIREEMDSNMSEILGLKRMYDMDPNCQRLEESRLQKLMAMKKNSEEEEVRDTPVEEVVGHLEGETLAKMIDFLDKEMIRLIDERKIHALILLAERERTLKEAAEGGRRFREEEARRANDEIFKQITGINQATVDLYLEEVFLDSCDMVADDQSRAHVKKMAETLNDAVASARHNAITDFEQEELAADLVSNFMIPELHRILHNSRIDAAGRRFKKAASQVVDAVMSAQPATLEVVDELVPIVDEHLIRSTAAFDGGIQLLDTIISDAVSIALKPRTQDHKAESVKAPTGTGDDSSYSYYYSKSSSSENKLDSSSEETKRFSYETAHTDKPISSSDSDPTFSKMLQPDVFLYAQEYPGEGASLGENEIRGVGVNEIQLPEEEDTMMLTEEIDSMKPGEEDEGKSSMGAESKPVEEVVEAPKQEKRKSSVRPPPKLTVVVNDSVVRQLAAKSVQVTYGTEVGQHIDSAFTGAHRTLEGFFDDVKYKIGSPRAEESGSDATLSDDTDD